MKINYKQLTIKTHYFFFMTAVGAVFPYLPVYGKQLGISPLIMGSIVAIFPILFLIFKPIIGFIMDYFYAWKKLIFVTILVVASSSYILLYFLPPLPGPVVLDHQFQNISCASLPSCDMDYNSSAIVSCNGTKNTICHWICQDTNFSMRLSFHGAEKEAIISPNTTCSLNINEMLLCQEKAMKNYNCNVICDNFENNCLYTSITFWGFILLMYLGNIGFNAFTCISDAICFEILGKGEEAKFGIQRLWAEVGFGVGALLTGYTIDLWSQGKIYKTYTPAFLLVFVFTCIDLICCRKLKLPLISRSTNIFTDVCTLLKFKSTVIFLCFAIIVGMLDSYVIFFLLWYVEDLAMETGYMGTIKLIEGVILAAQAFGSMPIFMLFSGKILKKLGYGYTFTFSLVCYALRLGLVSLAPTPWWIILIEFLTVGPTFALSYATIAAFANAISPPGVSVSVQGIMSGVKEGLGYTAGNLIGSTLLKNVGGVLTFRIYSVFAAFCALVYFLLYITYLKHKMPGTRNNVEWRKPEDAQRHCVVAE